MAQGPYRTATREPHCFREPPHPHLGWQRGPCRQCPGGDKALRVGDSGCWPRKRTKDPEDTQVGCPEPGSAATGQGP